MTNKKTSGCYRSLQTADWHLGKMLNEQSRDEDHAKFLEWLLLAVKEHEVDAIEGWVREVPRIDAFFGLDHGFSVHMKTIYHCSSMVSRESW